MRESSPSRADGDTEPAWLQTAAADLLDSAAEANENEANENEAHSEARIADTWADVDAVDAGEEPSWLTMAGAAVGHSPRVSSRRSTRPSIRVMEDKRKRPSGMSRRHETSDMIERRMLAGQLAQAQQRRPFGRLCVE